MPNCIMYPKLVILRAKKLRFIRENTGMANFFLIHICSRDAIPLTIKPTGFNPRVFNTTGFLKMLGFE